jgi:penicillin-binding protein 1A
MVKDRDGKLLEENKDGQTKDIAEIMRLVAAETPAKAATSIEASPRPDGADVAQAPTLPTYPLKADPDQVLDPRVAFVAGHLMKEVVSFGTGAAAKQLARPAAGKTGTTNDYQDAWFMGFTPTIVAGAWVGYDTQKPIGRGETGARAALPIWLDVMKEAVKNQPEADFEIPPGVVFASIHPETGKLVPPNASYAIKEAFIEGTQPREGTQNVNINGTVQPARSTGDFLKEDIE